MKNLKNLIYVALSVLVILSLVACGGNGSSKTTTSNAGSETTTANTDSEAPTVKASTSSFEDMVAYLTAKGFIAKDAQGIDINTTAGYVTDNTQGEMPFSTVATKAVDYDGLWLFWWDKDGDADVLQGWEYLDMNEGLIVIMGGANVLQSTAHKGYFAIAFAEDYARADAALEAFNAIED
ncbi:MAG: hypothetical protein J5789_02920 [Oscillospiraceae bacterium]|nr:hypothetical protein [Oscillospiraceae bacterium]MBR4393131.1 hypothetical protein [Oscillospiraceae bacterium]